MIKKAAFDDNNIPHQVRQHLNQVVFNKRLGHGGFSFREKRKHFVVTSRIGTVEVPK